MRFQVLVVNSIVGHHEQSSCFRNDWKMHHSRAWLCKCRIVKPMNGKGNYYSLCHYFGFLNFFFLFWAVSVSNSHNVFICAILIKMMSVTIMAIFIKCAHIFNGDIFLVKLHWTWLTTINIRLCSGVLKIVWTPNDMTYLFSYHAILDPRNIRMKNYCIWIYHHWILFNDK